MGEDHAEYQHRYALVLRRAKLSAAASVVAMCVGLFGANAFLASNGPWAPACAGLLLLGTCGLFLSISNASRCPRCLDPLKSALNEKSVRCQSCETWLTPPPTNR